MIQRMFSSLMIAAGLLLMGTKIAPDREAGGMPALLVAVGTVWLLSVQTRRPT